jgi:hypothetical protein
MDQLEFEIEISYGESDDVRTVQDVIDSVKRHAKMK